MSMYIMLNTLSEYTYFYMSKNMISFPCFENGLKPSKVFIKEVRKGIACSMVLLPFPIAIVSSRCE